MKIVFGLQDLAAISVLLFSGFLDLGIRSIVPTETERNDETLIPLTAHSDYEPLYEYTLQENPLNSKHNCGFTYDTRQIFTMHMNIIDICLRIPILYIICNV